MLPIALGFVLGFLIGLTGVGGGAVVAPALYVVLGLSYQESVSLSLIYALGTKIVSAIQHIRQKTVMWNITLLYGLAGVPGAVIGSRLMYEADEATQRLLPFFMSGILFLVSAMVLFNDAGTTRREKPFSPDAIDARVVAAVVMIQIVVGLVLGITSVGAGSLVILSMLYLFRMPMKAIVGSNIVVALIMVVPAGVTHYMSAGLDWSLLGLLLTGSLGGAILGSKTIMIASDRVLKYTIAALIAVAAVLTVVKAW